MGIFCVYIVQNRSQTEIVLAFSIRFVGALSSSCSLCANIFCLYNFLTFNNGLLSQWQMFHLNCKGFGRRVWVSYVHFTLFLFFCSLFSYECLCLCHSVILQFSACNLTFNIQNCGVVGFFKVRLMRKSFWNVALVIHILFDKKRKKLFASNGRMEFLFGTTQ